MTDEEKSKAHRWFAADCYNRTWTYMDNPGRTPDETQAMIESCLASMHHWRFREDQNDEKRSIGFWQASRVYALAGNAQESLRYGELCLRHAANAEPFYRAYAHEALARAYGVQNDGDSRRRHVELGRAEAAMVTSEEDREVVLNDLTGLGD
ncbi:MAG: hypothetical protein JNM85_07765 [Chthonomonas sp.]|nr:hypothetical protein [Chthonomonas sp.]